MLAAEIDLQAWCEPASERFPKPVVRNGFRYATDGRAMVCLPAPGEPDTESPAFVKVPDCRCVFEPAAKRTFAPWPADWESWETMEIEGGKEECPECHGKTHVCDCCLGFKQIECGECEQEYDCPDCEGKGYLGEKCAKCGNKGTIEKPGRAFRLAEGIWIDEKYLRRLVDLPNLQWSAAVNKPVFFRFDGGEAAVMPVIGKED